MDNYTVLGKRKEICKTIYACPAKKKNPIRNLNRLCHRRTEYADFYVVQLELDNRVGQRRLRFLSSAELVQLPIFWVVKIYRVFLFGSPLSFSSNYALLRL